MATFNQQRVVVVGKHAGQTAPALGGITQTKGFGDTTRDTAALEVINGALGGAQILAVGQAGFFQHAG